MVKKNKMKRLLSSAPQPILLVLPLLHATCTHIYTHTQIKELLVLLTDEGGIISNKIGPGKFIA